MTANIETVTLQELFNGTSDGEIPILIDIYHPDIVWEDESTGQEQEHLRLINNNLSVKYDGKKYLPSHFSFVLPGVDGKKIENSSITISAIDKRVVDVIRSIKDRPVCTVEAFYTKLSDTRFSFSKLYKFKFQMSSVSWNGVSAKWELIADPANNVNLPRDLATITNCPGVSQIKE